MLNRLLFLFIWFPTTFITLVTSLFLLFYYTLNLKNRQDFRIITQKPEFYQMYVSHPQALGDSSSTISTDDAIPEIVAIYLEKYNSPMRETAQDFVNIFRNYGIDPIAPLAIAQCESNLGKKMPPDCHNPFGLGIHSEGTLCFETWQEGYQKMAQILKEQYIDQGLTTIEAVMKKYCPISAQEKNGSWARCVNQFMERIETLKAD